MLGVGEGESEARGGGVLLFIENPRGGSRRGWVHGAGRVSAANGGILGGGRGGAVNIFFRG